LKPEKNNPYGPHKLVILFRVKIHSLLPTGECDVPAVKDTDNIILSIDAKNKEDAEEKLAKLIQKVKQNDNL